MRRMLMRRTITSVLSLGTVAGLSVLGFVSTLWAGDEKECSLATLNGDYLTTGRGIPAEGIPFRITVGLAVFDGKGGLSGRETWSTSGEIRRVTYTGTYTLDADCTGTLTVEPAHWDLVLAKDASEGTMIRTDPGAVITRAMKKR
jgi:hypothetical protein